MGEAVPFSCCCLDCEKLPVAQDSRVEVGTIATACAISASQIAGGFALFHAQIVDSSTTQGLKHNLVLKQLQTASKSSFSMLVCLVPGSVDKYLPVADCPLQKSLDILMAFHSADIGMTTPISALHVLCFRTLPSGLSAFLDRLDLRYTSPRMH